MADVVDPKEDLLKRLRRIEGQVRGVARMVEEDRDCRDVLQQLSAIRAAANQVSLLMARTYACQCLTENQETGDPEALVDDLIQVIRRAG